MNLFRSAAGLLIVLTTAQAARADVACVVPMHDIETGKVFTTLTLPGGGLLIGAEKGLFRFDPATRKLVQTGEFETGSVFTTVAFPDGGALIGAKTGWFRFDPATGKLLPAGDFETGKVLTTLALPDGGALIGAQKGWFRFDPATGKLVRAGDVPTGQVVTTLALPDGGVLIGARNGLFRFDPATGKLVRAGDVATGEVYTALTLSNGGTLIGAIMGLFRFDPATGKLVRADEFETGRVVTILALRGDGALIGTEKGLFRFDPATEKLVQTGDVEMGIVPTILALPGGGVLIGAEKGLFRFDPATGKLVRAGELETGPVTTTLALPGDGALIGAKTGWFRFDPATGKLLPAGDVETGSVFIALALPGGGALIGAQKGLFMAPAEALAKATVSPITDLRRLVQGPAGTEIRLSFEHPCAPVSGKLGLELGATIHGTMRAPVPVSLPYDARPQPTKSVLAAPIVFNQPGTWTLQLRQGTTPIGAAQEFPIAPPTPASLWDRIVAIWPYVLGAATVLYVLAFTVLLGLTRRHEWAFRIITDSVWAELLKWPFFAVRHVPAVQRWVLEPWFQAVRRTTRADVPYLDPPVSANAGAPLAGAALLGRLAEQPRLWLQGRSGMGKSSVFAAWERDYFAAGDLPSLRTAARRHGFILIMLPVRHFAALTPPDANKPQSWVLEAVRLRLEQFGFTIRDLGLIEAMLKAGHIALALDGTNEADRDGALTAFARTYPMVRLLVTSQTVGGEVWEVWRLPPDVNALRDELLTLWLGADKGATLARRIVAEGLSDTIVSGYDLRLVADLAGDDPANAALPGDRIALYRTMLARAKGPDGEALRLEGLKELAWTMVTQRRREITAQDGVVLGVGTLPALAKEGVRIVRQVGAVHEFRHDQMRAFLAALWLVEETSNLPALETAMSDAKAFALNRRDQEELWRFLAPLLVSDADLKALWLFANEKPEERAILLDALQNEADDRNVTLVRAARRRKPRAAAADA